VSAKPPVYPATATLIALATEMRPDINPADTAAAIADLEDHGYDPGRVLLSVALMIREGDEPRNLRDAVLGQPAGRRHKSPETDAELLERRYR
jgi:hypothetical protein